MTDRPAAAGTPYWAVEADAAARSLGCTGAGLSTPDAAERLRRYGPNRLGADDGYSRLQVLVSQLRNPLLLILLFAATASALTGEWIDSAIVIAIVIASVGISYSREYSARSAVAALQSRVRTTADVVRDGAAGPRPLDEVVPGDVVLLSAGSLVPGDAVLLSATDFFVGEAMLTGESFPVEKAPGVADAAAPIAARRNCVFFGTSVRSGNARALVVATGPATEFGAIAGRLRLRPPETEFDRGLRRFGYLLTAAMLVLVLAVFVVHVVGGRPPVETLLFAIALAVGLSPELLPAILSVNLARGAQQMANHGVLVRRLNAIENLGSMDVLCTDKTGTLTVGVVDLDGAWDGSGADAPGVLALAAWNARFQTGMPTPLDEAIIRHAASSAGPDRDAGVSKLAEVPFDFVRKRVSVAVSTGGRVQLITKGAVERVLDVCAFASGGAPLDDETRRALAARYDAWSAQGVRVLAVATRIMDGGDGGRDYTRHDETGLTFEGFLTFLDRPKPGVAETVAALGRLGVAVKVITGDSHLVARHLAGLVGLNRERVLAGRQLLEMSDAALWHEAERTDIFAEVDPNQKERIILALKKTGRVVGFLGDGINDAPAMHAADTSLSVDSAADVAREAADFVLLDRDLDVIRRGIEAGRATFANTLKYVLITMSANLGNMISMAAASLVLPFLPLLAGQILLNNFLSDVPAVGLADDAVDPEMVAQPERWNLSFIARFMVEFGLVSSIFDIVTFGTLLYGMRAGPELFRTGWFVESLLTELAVALVVRTRRPFYRSRPGRVLLWSTVAVTVLTLVIPGLPGAGLLGFVPLPLAGLLTLLAITAGYIAAVELTKHWFFRRGASTWAR